MEYIGTITGIKSFKGEMFVTDVPVGIEKLEEKSKIGVGYSSKFLKYYTLKSWKYSKKKSTIQFNEIKNEVEAQKLVEQGVFVKKEDIITEEIGLTDEIIGCKVIDYDTGEDLGKIIDVWYLPANDVWLLRMKDGELPLPVIDDVIKEVDLENEIIKVHLIDGLLSIKEPFKDEKK